MVKIKSTKSDKIFDFFNILLLSIILIIELYPLIFVVSASFSDPDLIYQGKIWLLPKGINIEGYRRVFKDKNILVGYKNTIFYTLLGTSINLAVTLPAAYSLSRKDFYGRNFFTALFSVTMFFSGGLIPTYFVVSSLGMRNTFWAMVIPGAASMWNIVLTRTFFQTNIPNELREAAQIDGSTNTHFFLKIVLPLSLPIVAVMALFYGVGHWNSYFNALIYISDRNKFPLQLILREILLFNQLSSEMDKAGKLEELQIMQAKFAELIKYAVIIVSTAPVIAIYPFLQKFFIKGIMVGAIKG
jgi:putative aldouronate transport system permease protein